MVYEFTASPVEARYFSEFERAAFKESFAIPSNFWIWLGRYDGVRPLHAFQQRAPKSSLTPPSLYTLTFTANFLAIQVFAFRSSEGDFDQLARGTKPGRLLLHYPAPNGWISWPPEITIDDEALDVLDTRFSLRSFVSSGRRFSADQLSALPLRFTRRSIAAEYRRLRAPATNRLHVSTPHWT